MSEGAAYGFILVFEGYVDEGRIRDLYAAGLDDTPIAYMTDEPDFSPFAIFARDGESLEAAIRTAIAQIESVHDYRVSKVDVEELLELREVAKRLGRSRWRAKKLLEESMFPAPATPALDGDPAVWLWADVAAWAGDMGPREEAATAARINSELQALGTKS